VKDYQDFLAGKAIRASEHGLDRVPELAPHLFPFQRECVAFALRAGASGCFLDTGLGKTEVQLEWCQRAIEATNAKALIWTPLAVAGQTKRRADRWGYEARVIREQSDARAGINICNYDRRDKIDPQSFEIVSLDEASILKNFNGKTTRALIGAFSKHRFKLAATATPAPNDHMELGQYCEFLDVMPSNEMLMRWFISDQTELGRCRLKGHAATSFWDWMASWARMAEKPSDLGDQDDGFILPPFELRRHRAVNSKIEREFADMFGIPTMSATTMHTVKRQTSAARAEAAAALVLAEPNERRIIWCDTDYEADAVGAALPDAIEVRGSMSAEQKEEILEAFDRGSIPWLVTKPSICGHGLDWSHCARMVFVGRSYSYETFYQAVRRCWRFGQKRKVVVDLIVAEGEETIGRVIDRKADDHARMKEAMREAMRRAMGRSASLKISYNPNHIAKVPTWLKSVA
jgi:Helicase conserved C-terminal domain